jgi:FkbM family methyltransferase
MLNPLLRRLIESMLARFDIRIERLSRHPTSTLLGISSLSFDTIIDVGANNGQFASMMLKRYPKAQVHSFEPLPEAFSQLEALSKVWAGRLHANNCALGAEEGAMNMFQHDLHTSSSSLLPTTEDCIEHFPQTKIQSERTVAVRRLDDVFEEQRTRGLGKTLVKLDVQGYEAEVIKGGQLTIAAAEAVIVEVCLVKLYVGGPSFDEISALLGQTGHMFSGVIEQVADDDGSVIFIDALFRK